MKLLLLLTAAACAWAGELGAYKTVYVFPMSSGFDQFLATNLTSSGVLQVVTDPQKADVILTDRIGSGFEEKLDEIYGKKQKNEDQARGFASVAHGRGLIFLVDRNSRNVVWSTYAQAKRTTPDELNHVASTVAARLNKDAHGKTK